MLKCTYEGCPNDATHLAPQISGSRIVWRPLCAEDQDAWWEGSDYPGGVGAPAAIRPVREGMEPALCHTVNGRTYVAIRGCAAHETIDSYMECIRTAYGSLHGVEISTIERVRLASPSRRTSNNGY